MNVILAVEDRETDVQLIKSAFHGTGVSLHQVTTGEECLMYLRKESQYFDTQTPDLVLLDLSLPGMDGREVLKTIKTDPALRYMPVIIFTGYAEDRDVFRQYDAGCNAYVQKPATFKELAENIRCIVEFWGRCAILPRTTQ